MTQSTKATLILSVQLFFIVVIFFGPLIEHGQFVFQLEPLVPYKIAGFFFLLLGAILFLASVAAMGLNFEVRAKQRESSSLVRRWPFSIVRNPVYLFGTLLCIGWSILMVSYVSALSTLLMVMTLILKIKLEETYLIEKFGEEYRRYMKEVPRLFPSRIW